MKKILIIDDEGLDLESMQHAIKDFDIEVLTTKSGENGVQIALQEKPDVIVCDTILKDGDGFEVCKRLKSHKDYSPKVIVITGVIDAVDSGRAAQVGADEYLIKTNDMQLIANAIKKLCKLND